MRVAVVRNVSSAETANGLSEPSRESDSAGLSESVADALREDGHNVVICEGDERLLPALHAFLPPAQSSVSGMVFNLARGVRGEAARSHVPAMLEMAGTPYTGPTPLGHALAFDTLAWRALLTQAGIPTTRYTVVRWPGDEVPDLRFPLLVSPRYARGRPNPRFVLTSRDLGGAIEEILAAGDHEAFLEEYVDSVEISAAFIGNDDELELLPLLERYDRDAAGDAHPAGISTTTLGMRIGAVAAAAFRTCRCQDYASIATRIDHAGRPLVVGIDAMPHLDRSRDFILAAVAGGYGPAALMSRILDASHRRYFGVPAPRFDISDQIPPERALRLFGNNSR